jgi:hypothetical protein
MGAGAKMLGWRRNETGQSQIAASHGAGAHAIPQTLPSGSAVDLSRREPFLKFGDVTQAVIDVAAVLMVAVLVTLIGMSVAFCIIVVPLLMRDGF